MSELVAIHPISRDMSLIHPRARGAFLELERMLALDYEAGRCPVHFKPFEVWRSPIRQEQLFKSKTTRARGWQSAHQYGLAVDFVPWTGLKGWHWDVPDSTWKHLHELATAYQLQADISWDPAHIEHRTWTQVRKWLI